MDSKETKRFEKLYQRHLRMLKLQGKSEKTRDAYARAIRRLRDHFDCSPDKIIPKQFESYFAQLVDTHSWSTVKVDCWGIKFFWKYVLEKDWQWIHIVKPPKIKSLPDILTPSEIEQLIGKTRKLRYRIFLLTTYSMGLRLSETLSLQVGDIDGNRHQVHIRRGKGHKDRFVPLPDLTLYGLRELWCKHRHPKLLFPNANGPLHRVKYAKNHMDRGGTQKAMKVVVHESGIKKKSPSIPCATALPHICWNAV
jgi:site-specific recombinase XerD